MSATFPFPSNDAFHCNCAFSATFKDKSCEDAFNTMKDKIEIWHPEPGVGGNYTIWDATEEETIQATRTLNGKRDKTDDILFDFIGNPKDFRTLGCTVNAKSRSQGASFYDHGTNFCNIWNVMKEVEGPDAHGEYKIPNIEMGECKFQPKDPQTTCQTY